MDINSGERDDRVNVKNKLHKSHKCEISGKTPKTWVLHHRQDPVSEHQIQRCNVVTAQDWKLS